MEYLSNETAAAFTDDFAEGLDGILTDEDRRFLEYSKQYGDPNKGH